MRIVFRILFLVAFVICFSCEKQGLFLKCKDCTEEEPINTNLAIKLDLNYFGGATIINVYEGNLEDSVLYTTVQTSASSAAILVTLNKKYTVTASYYKPDAYYIAVDSATPRVGYNKDQCDNPCYYVYDKDIDLRLKYTN